MEFAQYSDEQLWEIGNALMDNLMQASTEIDHQRHVQDFTQRLRDIVQPEYFERVVKKYQQEKGLFTERTPVDIFRRENSVAFVWKQGFSIAKGEFVAEMVMMRIDGRWLVDHAAVF